MNLQFHNRESVVAALAAGGLIAFAKDLAAGVALLYRFGVPQGSAALQVATLLVAAAAIFIAVLRK